MARRWISFLLLREFDDKLVKFLNIMNEYKWVSGNAITKIQNCLRKVTFSRPILHVDEF